MGRLNHDQEQFFYSFRLDDAVPGDHPVRRLAISLGRLRPDEPGQLWSGSMLPFNPFSFQPDQRPQYRSSKEWDVLRKQQSAERHHPKSQHRKKTENSKDDQK
jgi:hypothetical protein